MTVTVRARQSGERTVGPWRGVLAWTLGLLACGAGAGLASLMWSFEQGENARPTIVRLSEESAEPNTLPAPVDMSGPRVPHAPDSAPAKPGETATGALSPVPDPGLVKVGRNGPLPVIGADGRKVRDVYARPFTPGDTRPRIALVIGGLGLSRSMTDAAIRELPPAVTFSFSPYAKDLQLMVTAARNAGHEVMLELPMEPFDYPHNDPGPYTLLTQSDVDENFDKLDWLLSRFSGYAGVVTDQGDRLLSAPEDLKPIIKALSDRGLYFLDHGNAKRSMVGQVAGGLGMPWGTSISTVDKGASRAAIDSRLLQLEEFAREKGVAIGAGDDFPVTIDRIKAWAETLDAKGVVLAPMSAALAASPKQPSQ